MNPVEILLGLALALFGAMSLFTLGAIVFLVVRDRMGKDEIR